MLITGSEGFIGKALMDKVDAVGFDIKTGQDVRDLGELLNYTVNQDCIVHLAALPGVRESIEAPKATHETNLTGSLNVMLAARQRLLLASSCAADNFHSPYAISKRAMEMYAQTLHKNFNLNYCAMRFTNIYGPGSKEKPSVIAKMFKDALNKGEITIHGTGKQTRDFIYIDDVIDAIQHLSQVSVTGIATLYSGYSTTINQVAEIIQGLTKCKIVYNRQRDEVSPLRTNTEYMYKLSMNLEKGLQSTYEYFLNI